MVRESIFSVLLGRGYTEQIIDPACTGGGFGERNNQIGQLYQLHKDLPHIIIQGNHLALGQGAAADAKGTCTDQKKNRRIQHQESQGIQGGCQAACIKLDTGQQTVETIKPDDLIIFLHKSPDYADAGKVFPGGAREIVQAAAGFFLKRHRAENDAGE